MSTRRRQLFLNQCRKGPREPKYRCQGGPAGRTLRLASFRMPLILIGIVNVDNSAISDTVYP